MTYNCKSSPEFIEHNHSHDTQMLYNTLQATEKIKRVKGTITNTYFDESDTDRFTHYWLEIYNCDATIDIIDKSILDNKRINKDVFYDIFNCNDCIILNTNI